ncbi:MAG: hypothetical protein GTN62_00080, partial [Gemmatimonadales bacterium]|nr:hypothetical protein [Gemmatimonadales bacterium]NIN48505.1 hypothetical protein [Gemmatimonadales bacterium]NIP05969.1 hypothetical protein [Gemmatimonadales bacterium]NIQ99921.1 hypothetical protein [Gemmatimonadales bacterium]NIS64380.1 hypothetical protein [Gemmatimonadales bacterium]
MKKLGDRRGVALMLVLWLIVVLGAIAAGVVAAARSEVDVVMNVRTRSVARYAAESGVVAATAQLKRLLRIAATPKEQALVFRRLEELLRELQEQTLGSARFQVTVADLNARIDLNNADEATLLAFLQQFVDERKAEALVDALQDWKDDDDVPRAHGAEAQEYARVGSPFFPPNRPLQRLDDLTRISGFTDSVADVIAPYVTVYGDGRVNVNTAPKPVLAAVRGLGNAGADQIVSRREQGEVFES